MRTLCLQLAFLPHRFLYPHNSRSISHSHRGLHTVFAVESPPQDFIMDCKLHNASKAQTISVSKPVLASFAWWHHHVVQFVNLSYSPGGSGEGLNRSSLTIEFWIQFVDWWDIGCCRRWTTWGQAASFMSRLVCLINLNKAKSAFWLSLH